VDEAWLDSTAWSRSSITNTMRCGFFSSDRSIAEYAQRIWALKPYPVGRINEAP
jgi:glycogen phosphorylase